jgi:hypothetical protein
MAAVLAVRNTTVYTYRMDVESKLAILADAAKYDASCASRGALARPAQQQALF